MKELEKIGSQAVTSYRGSRSIGQVGLQSDAAGSQQAGRKSDTDEVHLSEDFRRFGSMREAAATLPEVRMDRVEALRAAIAAGTYSISLDAVADSLLSSAA